MSGQLQGKRILVTGAAGGLGKVTVRALLREGAIVTGATRLWKKEDQEPGLETIEADLSSPEGAAAVVKSVVRQHGGLDIVMHVVGSFSMEGSVASTRVETWDRMMDLNARSAFLLFRAALPVMLDARRGRLLAVGSRAGLEASPGMTAYAVSKAALHALVVNLAAEIRDTGITVNAVVPGIIDTPANRAAMPGEDFSRWVLPEAIAGTLVWLASDASSETSGALIPIYGRS